MPSRKYPITISEFEKSKFARSVMTMDIIEVDALLRINNHKQKKPIHVIQSTHWLKIKIKNSPIANASTNIEVNAKASEKAEKKAGTIARTTSRDSKLF